MKLRVVRADPAGNITLLVTDPVDPAVYGELSARLMALPGGDAEQVGFLTPPRLGGDARLEMMGGEFCGNATRSAALWFAKCQERLWRQVRMECSGSAAPLNVETDPEAGEAWIDMPLPRGVEDTAVAGVPARRVCFEGIVHTVFDLPAPREDLIHAVLEDARRRGAAAAGALFYNMQKGTMTPAVYVAATDTLVYENSCASGTAAVAAAECRGLPDGLREWTLRQPGGLLRAQARIRAGRAVAIRIGGPVRLEAPRIVEIEDARYEGGRNAV